MAHVERKHEVLDTPLDQELLAAKAADGWRPVGVVWERTVEGAAPDETQEAVPYGLRIAADCQTLEPAVDEIQTMVQMLRMIVAEQPFAEIARELNDAGLRTRRGEEWNQTSVFHMLPRLIEVAPSIYSSREWIALKPARNTES